MSKECLNSGVRSQPQEPVIYHFSRQRRPDFRVLMANPSEICFIFQNILRFSVISSKIGLEFRLPWYKIEAQDRLLGATANPNCFSRDGIRKYSSPIFIQNVQFLRSFLGKNGNAWTLQAKIYFPATSVIHCSPTCVCDSLLQDLRMISMDLPVITRSHNR